MDFDFLLQTRLFHGLTAPELSAALAGLQASEKVYAKGARIFSAGEATNRFALVLSGSVTVESNDFWGNRTILGNIDRGQVFAETFALLPEEPLLVDVNANEDCHLLFITVDVLLSGEDGERPSWMRKLSSNLLSISLHKNLMLSRRSFHTAPRSVRARVMSYLNTLCLQTGSDTFTIPFDRQQLADYLNLERSALSKELGKMQRDGLIAFKKNRFTIHSDGEA